MRAHLYSNYGEVTSGVYVVLVLLVILFLPTTGLPAVGCPREVPGPLSDFPLIGIELGDQVLTVALANNDSRRKQGLQNVSSLDPLEGMLFWYPRQVRTGFWMKDTKIPLQIGFFGPDGRLQETFIMTPCKKDQASACPVYSPEKPYRYALELPLDSDVQLEKLSRGNVSLRLPSVLVEYKEP